MHTHANAAFLVVTLLGSATAAQAGETAPATLSAQRTPDGPLRVSVTVAPLLGGQLDIGGGTFPHENQAAPALAVAGAIDCALSESFYVGFAPQYIFNVQKQAGGDAARQIDLALRLGATGKLGNRLALFTHVSPGFSMILLSPGSSLSIDNPKGVVLGFASGATFDLSRAVFASAELGYQFAFQSSADHGRDVAYNTRFFRLGAGIGVRL